MGMEQQRPKRSPVTRRRHLVIFADDEPEILLALERALRHEPYDLLMTTDPEKALHWIRTRRVSAVIADYRMPGMSGATLLEMGQAISPQIARILLTASPGESDVLRTCEAGAVTLLVKPWDELELKQTIRNRLSERETLEVH